MGLTTTMTPDRSRRFDEGWELFIKPKKSEQDMSPHGPQPVPQHSVAIWVYVGISRSSEVWSAIDERRLTSIRSVVARIMTFLLDQV